MAEKNTEMGRLKELDGRWLENTAISLVRNKNLHEQTEFVTSIVTRIATTVLTVGTVQAKEPPRQCPLVTGVTEFQAEY